MGVAIYIRCPGEESQSYPVVGASELNQVWRPVIDQNDLQYVDCIVTGGLSLDAENYNDVLAEFEKLFEKLDSHDASGESSDSHKRRARLLEIVRSNPPGGRCEVYIG